MLQTSFLEDFFFVISSFHRSKMETKCFFGIHLNSLIKMVSIQNLQMDTDNILRHTLDLTAPQRSKLARFVMW